MRIRIGNDITIRWDIYRYNDGLTSENTTGSIAEDLTNAINLTVKLGIYGKGIVSTLTEVTANVNLLTVHVPKELTPQVGKYYVVLDYDKTNIELDDKLQHYRLDSYAFDLVSYTASADDVTDIAIESQLVAGIDGINGLSAYELAVHYEGFTGTVEEYLESLRNPAIEAKEEVDVALAGYEGLKNQLEDGEETRIYNEQLRVSSETSRMSAETTRVSNETARVEAEDVRESAEGNRVDAEAARATAEENRTTAEASRVTAETARATAETTRASAESQRVANENTRGENEGSRVAAETARVASEDNRVSAESARGINEGTRVAAETARAGAEVTRVNNETNRVAAEQARVAFFDTVSGEITELRSDLSDELKGLYNKIKINPVFTQGGYDSSGNLFNTAEYQYTSFDVSEFAGGWMTIKPAIPADFAAKSMVVDELGNNTLFGGTFGSEITVQLGITAKTVKLSIYKNVTNPEIYGFRKGYTINSNEFIKLKNEFYDFKDLDIIKSAGVNLFDKSTMIFSNKYIDPINLILSTGVGKVARIPISVGTYSINVKSIPTPYENIVVETDINTPSIPDSLKLNSLPYDVTGNGRVFTITNTNVKYILFQVHYSTTDLTDTLQVQKGNFITNYEPYQEIVKSINGSEVRFDFQKALLSYINYITNNNKLYGKKLGVLGDSISYGYGLPQNIRYDIRNSYAAQLAERNNMTINLEAITGSCLAVAPTGETLDEFVNRYNNIDDDCDYIIIFGGTNDVNTTTPIGSDDDMVKTTIKGALNIICSGIIDKAPSANILLITPLNYKTNIRLIEICDAVEAIGKKYSLPVLNLYKNGNYAPVIASQLLVYGANGTDIFHPNLLYHSILARKIERLID